MSNSDIVPQADITHISLLFVYDINIMHNKTGIERGSIEVILLRGAVWFHCKQHEGKYVHNGAYW